MPTPQNPETGPSNPTGSEARTRSGRVSKPPTRYEPVEQVEDDYGPGDYDTEESDGATEESFAKSDEDEDDDDDADDDGNLDGFVVPDKSESDSDDNDGQPAVPDRKRRTPVKKRPAPVGKRVAGKR